MESKIVSHNADVLWNSLENANFNVDHEGRLSVISKWNFIERLIKWIGDWDGSITAKVNQVVQETLDCIVDSNNQHKRFYVHDKGNSWFFDATRAYSPHYTAYHLADKIQKDPHFSAINTIQQAALEILKQKDIYPNSKEREQIIMGPIYSDSKILYWDELES